MEILFINKGNNYMMYFYNHNHHIFGDNDICNQIINENYNYYSNHGNINDDDNGISVYVYIYILEF